MRRDKWIEMRGRAAPLQLYARVYVKQLVHVYEDVKQTARVTRWLPISCLLEADHLPTINLPVYACMRSLGG